VEKKKKKLTKNVGGRAPGKPKKELTKSGWSEDKCKKRKVKPKKSTSYSYHRDKKQFLASCAKEKAASKSTSWGVENAVRS